MTYAKQAGIVLWGLGALGSRVLNAISEGVDDLKIVAVVDRDERLAGRRLREMFPSFRLPDLPIHPDFESFVSSPERDRADVVLHMTESYVPAIQSQLEQAMSAGFDVISASEGMFHPGLRFPEVAAALHKCAVANGVSVVGCGINPGFSFDSLVMVLGRVTTAVTSVSVSRVVEVTGTGMHDIDHVGFGLPTDEFRAKLKTGRIVGHMAMPESIAAIAERFGLAVERIEERWQPHTWHEPIESGSDLGIIQPGCVVGISQTGEGYVEDRIAISMKLEMYYGPQRFGLDQMDDIVIEGHHRVHASLTPAAVSIKGAGLMMLNAVHDVMAADPGLVNVMDFSMAGRRRGGFELVMDPDRQPTHETTWLIPRPYG